MSMVVLDPKTGLVKAMVGGRDFQQSQVNLALGGACPDLGDEAPANGPLCLSGGGSGRQPGSAFKPFTLAKAFEKGFTVDRSYRGPGTYRFPNCRGEGCTVHNVESGSYGTLDLRRATAYSVNTVYAQLIQDVGVKETAELAHRLGLTMVNPKGLLPNGEPYGASLTLGAAEVSPLDMAAAFGVFAARGMQFPASPVVKVTDGQGKVLEDNSSRNGKRVLAGDVADRVTDVLKDVVGYGTGKAAEIGRPDGTAGKTGTSEAVGDAWFVGYTPSLVASVWMGYADSHRPLQNIKGVSQVYGGTIPALTWKEFMTAALEGTPPLAFGPAPAPPPPVTTPAGYQPPATAPPTAVTPAPGPALDSTGLPIGQYPPFVPDVPTYQPPTPVPTTTPPVTAPDQNCLLCRVLP
jgi:penicillin-binding protein 1A